MVVEDLMSRQLRDHKKMQTIIEIMDKKDEDLVSKDQQINMLEFNSSIVENKLSRTEEKLEELLMKHSELDTCYEESMNEILQLEENLEDTIRDNETMAETIEELEKEIVLLQEPKPARERGVQTEQILAYENSKEPFVTSIERTKKMSFKNISQGKTPEKEFSKMPGVSSHLLRKDSLRKELISQQTNQNDKELQRKRSDSHNHSTFHKVNENVKRVKDLKIDMEGVYLRDKEPNPASEYVTGYDMKDNELAKAQPNTGKQKSQVQDDKSIRTLVSIDGSHMKSVLDTTKIDAQKAKKKSNITSKKTESAIGIPHNSSDKSSRRTIMTKEKNKRIPQKSSVNIKRLIKVMASR